MVRVTRVNNKNIFKNDSFSKKQTIFVKYIDKLELHDSVKRLRKKLRVDDYGFSESHQVLKWLEREGQGDFFDSSCWDYLVENELPESYYNLLRDYVLTSFRFKACVTDEDEELCEVLAPNDHFDAPHYNLKIYEGATPDDIRNFIKANKEEIQSVLKKQSKIDIGKSQRSPEVYTQQLIIRDYKKMNLKDLLDEYVFDQAEKDKVLESNTPKTIVIQRLLEKRHRATVSFDMIENA